MIYRTVIFVMLLIGSTEMAKKKAGRKVTSKKKVISDCANATNQEELVQYLIDRYKIPTKIRRVFKLVDRKHFYNVNPYEEPAGKFGVAVNTSAPHMHATLLKLLDRHLLKNHRALDVGCGSGYLTACMAILVGTGGFVVGMDREKASVKAAKNCVSVANADLFKQSRLVFVEGDGKTWEPGFGYYDAIVVQGAVTKVPESLLEVLDVKGRMLIPIITESSGEKTQDLWVLDKHNHDNITRQKEFPVFYNLL